ncbi:MAG: hypothetical protein KBT46_09475, partial [Ruminococcus sp.]|nr:hypothetical protein [Candidatus Copronaster equi]
MKEKFQMKKRSPFFVAIVMLIISAIVITSASFAWFTLGKNGGVREMDVKISSKEGIQISGNTEKFTTYLEKDELDGTKTTDYSAYSGNTNKFPTVISPSSSDFKFSVGSLPKFFTGGIAEKADKTQEIEMRAVTNTDGKDYADGMAATYYVFDVFVKYEGEKDTLDVSTGKSTVTVKKDTEDSKAPVENSDVEKAMRIGFVNLGTVASAGAAGSTYAKNDVNIFAPKRVDGTAKSVTPIGSAGTSTSISGSVITGGSVLSSYPTNAVASSGTDAKLTLASGVNRVR